MIVGPASMIEIRRPTYTQSSSSRFGGTRSRQMVTALLLRFHSFSDTCLSSVGAPHRLMQDDVYQGYLIPAGTFIFTNVWYASLNTSLLLFRPLISLVRSRGILHDEKHFPEPSTFNPDRWLDYSDPAHPRIAVDDPSGPIDPYIVALGYGRRNCQGMSFAQSELWIAAAALLSHFEIKQKIDSMTQKPIVPVPEWTGDSVRYEIPFFTLLP